MPSRVSSAQVEGGEGDVGPPWRMVEPAVEVRGEGVLAGVAPRAVPAVVAEGDGLGQGHVEPTGPGHAGGHLGHLEGVGQPGPLVVVGEHEDLGLAGQSAEGGGVEDAVPIPLEAGPPAVGLLGPHPPTRAVGPGWPPVPAGRPPWPRGPGGRVRSDHPRTAAGRRRPTEAWLSAWAKVIPGPPWPAMVDAQRRFRSLGTGPASDAVPTSGPAGCWLGHRSSVPHGCDARGAAGRPVPIGTAPLGRGRP